MEARSPNSYAVTQDLTITASVPAYENEQGDAL